MHCQRTLPLDREQCQVINFCGASIWENTPWLGEIPWSVKLPNKKPAPFLHEQPAEEVTTVRKILTHSGKSSPVWSRVLSLICTALPTSNAAPEFSRRWEVFLSLFTNSRTEKLYQFDSRVTWKICQKGGSSMSNNQTGNNSRARTKEWRATHSSPQRFSSFFTQQ